MRFFAAEASIEKIYSPQVIHALMLAYGALNADLRHAGIHQVRRDASSILLAPRRQERQVRNRFFLCGLCAFARGIPTFGCGSAALGASWSKVLLLAALY
jgi:hypothetical protein